MLQSNVCGLTDKETMCRYEQLHDKVYEDTWKMYINFSCRQPIYILMCRHYCDHGLSDYSR